MRAYASVIDDPVRFYRDENQQSRTTESTHGIVDRESIGLPRSAQLNAANAMVCKCGGRTCCDERVLALLSSAPSKAATNHETRESGYTEASSNTTIQLTNDSSNDKGLDVDHGVSEPIETLFIPEDPSEYEQILHYVRRIFERVEQSISPFDREIPKNLEGNVAGDRTDEDRFSKLEDLRERNSRPSEREEDEEKYLQRNPEGGVSPRTTVENNRKDEVTPMERNNYDVHYNGKSDPDEEDLLEVANFGLDAMKDLYTVKEPMLYSMGLYLDSDNPARHVAIFNDQTEEARTLAKYGFAVLQSTAMFRRKFPNIPTDSLLSRRSQSNPLQRSCPNRGVPNCPAASLRYRTSDGSCNNLQNLWWGSAMSPMQRFLLPVYDDGIQSARKSVTGRPLPSARQVTTVIHEDRDVPLESVTHMLMQWGQFVDHDLTATGQSRGFNGSIPQCCLKFGSGFQPPEFMHPECLPISVTSQDSFFGPLGVRCLEFVRSGPAPKENCEFGPREQLSQVTSYLDASPVYSSNAFQTDSLRLFRNGLLQYGRIQSQRPVLPKLHSDLCRHGSLSTSCFRAGDGRLGEQPALTSLHVVFLRLHNRVATKLAALNAHWSDEKLFQESRRIVGAIVQHITYREFLPIVLGQDVMKIFDLELLKKGYYEGYDPTVNPTIANAFSTAAYRFGHSLVQHSFIRFDSDHQPIFNNVSIHNEFTNPVNLETAGSVDRLLLGLINQRAQRRDEHITEELTNHLFQTPNFPFGMDLASINIQRGRDHGIPPYVQWREPCALSRIRDFDDLDKVMPPSTARRFRLVYSSVEDIDLFTAGLAEKSVKGGLVGPTFACIIGQQFSNSRRGDRFWYENSGQESTFTPGQLQQIRRVTLAQVLCATMDNIETLQPFVFLTQDTMKNQRLSCNDPAIGQLNLDFWAERPPRFKGLGILDKIKQKITSSSVSTPKPTSSSESPKEKRINVPLNLNPPKVSIHQQNRIVVKKPLGPSDNVTIVVQNNAINSPVFVNDAIYGSSIKINPSLNQQTRAKPALQESLRIPIYSPQTKPISTTHSPVNYIGRPYIPYTFDDPNNPNPLSQGFQPGYIPNDVVFESFPGTSPRPTLYTYYTNFQKPTTQQPAQNVDDYTINYKPQDHGTRPTSWPESQYHNRPPSRPPYSSSEQLHENQGYGTNIWQKLQYRPPSLVNQPSNAGYGISQDYTNRPTSPLPQQGYLKESEDRYTTWPSVSFDKKTGNNANNQQYSSRPPYQAGLNKKPIQASSNDWFTNYGASYQTELPGKLTVSETEKEGTVNPNSVYVSSSARPTPIYDESNKDTSGFYSTSDYNIALHSTPIYKPAQNDYQSSYIPENSYHTLAQSKPSKIHSVTIVTEPSETMSQTGHDIDKLENRVTSEIPKPLAVQAGNSRVRKPGQYYYEKNVLHRYPDKPDDQKGAYNVEQRHKTSTDEVLIDETLIDTSMRNQQLIESRNQNSTNKETMNETRNELSDTITGDDMDQSFDEAFSREIEGVASGYRTSHWLNPQEDSSLPSAMEMPKIPSDKSTAAKELPKPMKLRNYAT
ncbi:Chorion peroxidase [Eufriesea mexicana]|nr:Chorion peroxidase [Eufriesea mexicana]